MISIDVEALAGAIAERLELQVGPRWLRITEAAEYMRVSESWIRERMGRIPHVRVDGKLLFDRQALDAWLTDHTEGRHP